MATKPKTVFNIILNLYAIVSVYTREGEYTGHWMKVGEDDDSEQPALDSKQLASDLIQWPCKWTNIGGRDKLKSGARLGVG